MLTQWEQLIPFGVRYKWATLLVLLIVARLPYNMNTVPGPLVNLGCSVSMPLLVLTGVGAELASLMLTLIIVVCRLMSSLVSMAPSVVLTDLTQLCGRRWNRPPGVL